jgi:hypothetical protein
VADGAGATWYGLPGEHVTVVTNAAAPGVAMLQLHVRVDRLHQRPPKNRASATTEYVAVEDDGRVCECGPDGGTEVTGTGREPIPSER